jgi:uncharacterized membrane protein
MARIAIVFGGLLIALGLGDYLGTGRESVFDLIPTLFGLVILGLGLAALREAWRKNAVHTAVVVGLVGFVAMLHSLIRLVSKLLSEPSLLAQSMMSILCAVFVLLCVKSFIDARRSRKTAEGEPLNVNRTLNGS